jgi:hypothetical protein
MEWVVLISSAEFDEGKIGTSWAQLFTDSQVSSRQSRAGCFENPFDDVPHIH